MRRLPTLSSVVDLVTMVPRASFTSVDFGSRIDFHVRYERRWLGTAAGLIFVGFAFKQASSHHDWAWFAFGVVGACGVIADRLHGSEVHLKVSADGVETSGNLGRMFSTESNIPANEFESLGYEIGGGDRRTGLYAQRAYGGVCIMPYLSEDKCREIAEMIYRRFPDLGTGDSTSGSMLYAESADPISLGLSKRR